MEITNGLVLKVDVNDAIMQVHKTIHLSLHKALPDLPLDLEHLKVSIEKSKEKKSYARVLN